MNKTIVALLAIIILIASGGIYFIFTYNYESGSNITQTFDDTSTIGTDMLMTWSYDINSNSYYEDRIAEIVIDGPNAYIHYDHKSGLLDGAGIMCISDGGQKRWSHEYAYNVDFDNSGGLAVLDNRVYSMMGNNSFYCYNASNGQVIWNKTIDIHEPKIIDYKGKVIMASSKLMCLNVSSTDNDWAITFEKYYYAYELAACNDGILIELVGGGSRQLICYEISDGSIRWFKNYPGNIKILTHEENSNVIVSDERSDKIICYDSYSGETIWEREFDIDSNSPLMLQNNLYINYDSLYCIDIENGETIWEVDVEPDDSTLKKLSETEIVMLDGEYISIFSLDSKTIIWKYCFGAYYVTITDDWMLINSNILYSFQRGHSRSLDFFIRGNGLSGYGEIYGNNVELNLKIYNNLAFNGAPENYAYSVFLKIGDEILFDNETAPVSRDGLNTITGNMKIDIEEGEDDVFYDYELRIALIKNDMQIKQDIEQGEISFYWPAPILGELDVCCYSGLVLIILIGASIFVVTNFKSKKD